MYGKDPRLSTLLEALDTPVPDYAEAIDVLETLVNGHVSNRAAKAFAEQTEKAMAEAPPRVLFGFDELACSCLWALVHTVFTDGRNEASAMVAGRLVPWLSACVMTEAVERFARMHHTLQQTAAGWFFAWYDLRERDGAFFDEPQLTEAIAGLRDEYGDDWYVMPFI